MLKAKLNVQLNIIRNMLENGLDNNINDISDISVIFKDLSEIYGVALIKAELFSQPKKEKIIFKKFSVQKGSEEVYYESTVDTNRARVVCACQKGTSWDNNDRLFLNSICLIVSYIVARVVYCKFSRDLFYYDIYTRLPNKNGLERFCENLNDNGIANRYSAILINIKRTNYLNKKLGYTVALGLIKDYANNINAYLDTDEIIARITEDNFMLVVKNQKVNELIKITEGREVSYTYKNKTYIYNMQARAGVLAFKDKQINFEKCFSSLTTAVHYARNFSHNDITICSDKLEKKILEMLGYIQLFRESLSNGDFFVVYQPKVHIKNNTLCGAEALVRWHYDGDIVMPSNFIGALEREHLICSLDWYVMEKTCKNIRDWMDLGITPVRISVNFSNDHLHEQDAAQKICFIADKHNVPHEYIEVEITETIENEDMDKLFEFVNTLRSMNFKVAIDDFGTGYSSLHLLDSISVDVLKIDKTFVNQLTDKQKDRKVIILENIINMANQLGIEVIAEGVETAEQLETLRALNCCRIQGFIFDKPLTKENFTKRLSVKKY